MKRVAHTGYRRAFSLVEVLAAITVIGIVTFLAIPSIVRVKTDAEDNLARARADALNIAAAAYFQSAGKETALQAWSSADNEGRYELVSPWLSFAPATLDQYMPSGYSVTFDANEPHRVKASLLGPDDQDMPY